MTPQQLASNLTGVIINPLLALLFAAALFVFIWGVVQFLGGLANGSEKKDEGKQHMLWGIVGLLIMTIAWAIITLVLNTFTIPVPTLLS